MLATVGRALPLWQVSNVDVLSLSDALELRLVG